jgi:hypothetical protein
MGLRAFPLPRNELAPESNWRDVRRDKLPVDRVRSLRNATRTRFSRFRDQFDYDDAARPARSALTHGGGFYDPRARRNRRRNRRRESLNAKELLDVSSIIIEPRIH